MKHFFTLSTVSYTHLGEDKIIDIALKYGYESPTAFNRAFQAVHGIAPSLVRKKNVQIKSFPALKFTFSIQGLDELSFRIEKKDSFKILGISSLLSKELLENFVQKMCIRDSTHTNSYHIFHHYNICQQPLKCENI